jgi:hypothetical protein
MTDLQDAYNFIDTIHPSREEFRIVRRWFWCSLQEWRYGYQFSGGLHWEDGAWSTLAHFRKKNANTIAAYMRLKGLRVELC